MVSNSSQNNGEKADWKATAEIITGTWTASTSHEQGDTDAPQGADMGKAKIVDWRAIAEMLTVTKPNPGSLSAVEGRTTTRRRRRRKRSSKSL
jgi:hypothetical protein